tara:strand:+ start:699 stop:3404 length:2706 start_codon:yes stop_codon:yes gene_type:complete
LAAKSKTYRIQKVAVELNVSFGKLIEHLNENNFDVEDKITAKISQEMYDLLQAHFSADKEAKEESLSLRRTEKVEKQNIHAQSQKKDIPKKQTEEEIILIKDTGLSTAPTESSNKTEEKQNSAEETPPIKEENKQEKELDEILEKNKLPGIKVLDKIDLNPKKKVDTPENTNQINALSEEQTIEDKLEPLEKITTPSEENKPKEEESEKPLIKPQYEKLKGLSVKGKIELKTPIEKKKEEPKKGNTDEEDVKKKKRRRRKVISKTGQTSTSSKPNNKKTTHNKFQRNRNTGNRAKHRQKKRDNIRKNIEQTQEQNILDSKILQVTEFVTANELANLMDINVNQIITACFSLGMMISINQRLDAETIELLAEEFEYEIEFIDAETQIDIVEEIDNEEDMQERPPIVTIMGHVDHGKTSLLDHIRNTNVIAGEAGGITQHVAAYEVTLEDDRKITFIDTPGHEAFTAMRARGAKVTDMAIIVIAADDRVMPQTKEAISHAQAADVPIVFAFNKIDKDTANPDKIREELSAMNILVEEWGGQFQAQEISAKTGLNVDELLEKVLLESEILELKANPNKKAKGTILEARMEKGMGVYTSVLVQEGTLKVGDSILGGSNFGKVKALFNERGQRIQIAGPSAPVGMLGFNSPPTAGDIFQVLGTEQEVKEIASKRQQLQREQGIRAKKLITLDEIGRRLAIGNFKELNLIIKGDVDGSVEALGDSLLKLSTEEIQVNVIYKSVGAITESDVLLATASEAIIIGFQVRPTPSAKKIAIDEGVEIKTYSVIYKAIEEVKAAMEGMLEPDIEEKEIGSIEVRDVFKISKVGTIAGCYVLNGEVKRDSKIRIIRDGVVIHDGLLESLKRFKDDVKEVKKGYECGLQIKNFNDIQIEDMLEVYQEVEIKRKL